MALRFDLYDIPFVGKLDERINPRILSPGSFVILKNVEFLKSGELAKRPGVAFRFGAVDGTPAVVNRFFRWREQIGVVDGTGNDSTNPAMYIPVPDGSTYLRKNLVSAPTVERRPLFHDLSQDVSSDVACAGEYVVHVAWCFTDNNVVMKIVSQTDGSMVTEAILDTITGGQASIRAAASGTRVLVTWSGGAANTIFAVEVNCSVNPPTFSGNQTLLTDEETGGNALHDLCGRNTTSPTWVLAYRSSTSNLNVLRVDTGPTAGPTVNVDIAGAPLAISVDNNQVIGGGTTYVNYYANAGGAKKWRYAAINSSMVMAGGAPWDWYSSTVVSPRISTLAIRVDGSALLLHCEWAGTSDTVPVMSWATGSATGTVGTVRRKRRPWIISDAWRKNAKYYLWVKDTTEFNTSNSAILLELGEDTLQAMVCASELPAAVGNQVTETLPSSVSSDGTRFRTALRARYIPVDTRVGTYEMSVRYDHLGRYQNAMFGGSTYLAGGVLLQYDGIRAFENGFPQAPIVDATRGAGSGTWGSTGTVTYVGIYETIDSGGERHRGFLGPPVQVTLTAATDEVALVFEHLTISRRFWSATTAAQEPRVMISIYRSEAPNSIVMRRLFRFDGTPAGFINDPERLTAGTYTDTGASILANEELYTLGGNLENSMPIGGCAGLEVHKERLWVYGGSELDVIRISKQFVTGEPAQFAIGLELRIPGEEIVAMRALNEVLVAFAPRRIYKIIGDGPNDTGDPATGWWTVAPIDTDVGCRNPRSVVDFPGGIIFLSDRGFYLMGLDQTLEFVGADVQGLITVYPNIRAAEVVANKQQVRFYATGLVGGNTQALVFDYFEKKWSHWEYTHPGEVADAIYADGLHQHVTTAGNWYGEQNPGVYADGSAWYGMHIKLGNSIFSHLHGQKSMGRFMVQGDRRGTHNLRVRYYRDDYLSQEWLIKDTDWSASPLYQMGFNPRWKFGQNYTWEFLEEQYIPAFPAEPVAATAGPRLTGMSAAVATLGGLRRMPARASR